MSVKLIPKSFLVKRDAQNVISRESYLSLSQAAIMGSLAVYFYAPVVGSLITDWYEHENFSYGFLIPFVSFYLMLQRRNELRGQPLAPTLWGVVALIASISVGLVGAALGEPFLSRLSLVVTVAALVAVVAGWDICRLLIFPLGYLLLMVPPPYVIVKEASYFLKLLDAVIATEILQLIGVPIYRDLFYLHLPNITLEIADVCSGIASLFAMMALGIIYVYFLPIRYGAKVALAATLVIFPIAANLFRIILIGASVYYYGPIMLQAFFHQFTGTFTFLLSLVMVMVFGEWLRRRYSVGVCLNQLESERREEKKLKNRLFPVPLLLGVAVLSVGIYVSDAISRPSLRPSQRELAMPDALGPFSRVSASSVDPYLDPDAEQFLSRIYQREGSRPIETYIGYRSVHYGVDRLRSPRLVFPQGWEQVEMGRIEIAADKKIQAVWLLTKKNNVQKLVVFWYQLSDKAISSELLFRWEIIRSWMMRGQTKAVVVRLATDFESSETVDERLQHLIAFSQQIAPYVQLLFQNKA